MPDSTPPDLRAFLESHPAGRVPGDLIEVLVRFAEASTKVRAELAIAPLSGMLGSTGEVNVQQESTAKLDDRANEIFRDALSAPGVARLISEEDPDPVEVGDGPYTCCFDPLDGSSNIGVAAVGSVLGVYSGVARNSIADTGITGRMLEAAAFTVYGLPAILVLAVGGRADGFAFDPRDDSWRLAFPAMRIPGGTYTSINWTYRDRWSPAVVAGVDAASEGLRGRYSGSMVEDMLRVLMAGGVFLYPEDSASPSGKLRMLYEICPMGFIVEAAGGAASDGAHAVLDVSVTTPHQRGPFIVGSPEAVARYEAAYRAHGAAHD
jgi:fructose-1,6-bisphosphatase I